MEQILIFKTNISTKKRVHEISTLFDPIKQIKDWSIDLEDCDRVLRVISLNIHYRAIEELLTSAGIYCKQMACFDLVDQH